MAFEKLRQSPCFKEMHDRLEAGNVVEKVAEWAQDTGGCFAGQKRDSVIRTLYRYKKTMVPTAAAVTASVGVDGKPSLKMWERLKDVQKDLNEVEMLERLILLQMTRIDQGVGVEQQINFLDKNVRREVELAATMLEKSAELKMKLGIYKKAPTELRIDQTTRQAVEAIPETKREAVQGAAKAILLYLQAGGTPGGHAEAVPEAQDAEFEVVQASPASP